MYNTEEFRKLTESLPAVPKLEDLKIDLVGNGSNASTYKMDEGTVIIYPLLNESDVYVFKAVAAKGSNVLEYVHEKKYVVVVNGLIEVEIGDECISLGPSDSFMIDKDVSHSVKIVEDSCFIVIHIPRSEVFKDVK